ncbi:MAG: glycosyltransferase family 2 protein [Patescibacteria group bacterium]|nr:glycosyltransferase family 2 protein [Patescibacteria group bacterium]
MLSIIIPSYNEPYLVNTINSILENAHGDIEIFVNVDDGKKVNFGEKDKRVKFHYPSSPLGMRGGINRGLSEAKGKYIMKVDAHCVFAPGFDVEICNHMQENWLIIPRRYGLYADGWRRETRFPPKDYHYLCYPINTSFGLAMFPIEWKEKRIERKDFLIDDTMTFQGSCYVANRKYFMKTVGFLDDNPKTCGTFGGEQMEVGLKYWLNGGEVKVNKKTWYGHLFKNSRYYKETGGTSAWKHKSHLKYRGGWKWLSKHFLNNENPKLKYKFSWLLEKFWPVPTWPEDRNLWVYPEQQS